MMTGLDVVGRQKDLSSTLALTDPNRVPVLNRLVTAGRVQGTDNKVVLWVDYGVKNTQTTLATAIDNVVTTVVVAAGDGELFAAGQIIKIEEEAIEIVSISTDTLTVTRGALGTTAAAHAVDLEIYLIADGFDEGSAFAEDGFKKGVDKQNYTQIFKTGVSVSGTEATISIPSADGKTAWDLELERVSKRHDGKIEKAIMQGTPSVTGTKRTVGGLSHYLSDGGYVLNAGATDVSMDTINNFLRVLYNRGAELDSDMFTFIVPPLQKNKISALLKDYITSEPRSNDVLGQVVNFIDTDYGRFELLMSNNLRADEMYLVNFEDITYRPQVGRGGNRTKLFNMMGLVGDSYQGEYVSEGTLEIRNIQQQGKIVNLKK